MIMGMRNITPSLKNGTRLKTMKLLTRLIEVRIMAKDPHKDTGTIVLLTKVKRVDASIGISRTQLLLRVSKAMIMKKSQCQTPV